MAISSTEASLVCQRGWWLWVGEGDPSCEGHEYDLGASPLVHLPHTLTPRISCRSIWHYTVAGESMKLTKDSALRVTTSCEVREGTRKKIVPRSHRVCLLLRTCEIYSLPPSLHVASFLGSLRREPWEQGYPAREERLSHALVRLTFRTFVMSL